MSQSILQKKLMKIWIDARIIDENTWYSQYIGELLEEFIQQNSEHEIILYTKENLNFNRHSLLDDFKVKKILEREKFHLMIFFDHYIPHGYSGEYIVMIENLKEVFFPKKKYFARKAFTHTLKKAIKHCQKVLVMDSGSAMELNENLNVSEEKIKKVHGFFPKYTLQDSDFHIDIKTKHNLRWEYLIYDSWNELHHNFERILRVIAKLKEQWTTLYIVILCDETIKDIDIRATSLDLWISDQIIFHWKATPWEEAAYYRQSAGVIFSSIYESFPFHFSKAIAYNCHIFANEIPANMFMGKSISYLDPLSIHNMCDTIRLQLLTPQKVDYSDIKHDFSPQFSSKELHQLIDSKD